MSLKPPPFSSLRVASRERSEDSREVTSSCRPFWLSSSWCSSWPRAILLREAVGIRRAGVLGLGRPRSAGGAAVARNRTSTTELASSATRLCFTSEGRGRILRHPCTLVCKPPSDDRGRDTRSKSDIPLSRFHILTGLSPQVNGMITILSRDATVFSSDQKFLFAARGRGRSKLAREARRFRDRLGR